MLWLCQNWTCEGCLSHSKIRAEKEDRGRGTYKLPMRRHGQTQMRMRKLSGLVVVFTRYIKAYDDNVDCTRTAT